MKEVACVVLSQTMLTLGRSIQVYPMGCSMQSHAWLAALAKHIRLQLSKEKLPYKYWKEEEAIMSGRVA